MYRKIDRGRLFCNDSVSYCDLDYDLVPDKLVDDADKICDELGYKKYLYIAMNAWSKR